MAANPIPLQLIDLKSFVADQQEVETETETEADQQENRKVELVRTNASWKLKVGSKTCFTSNINFKVGSKTC